MGLFKKAAEKASKRLAEEKAAWDAADEGVQRRKRRMDRDIAKRKAAQAELESGTCIQKGCTRPAARGFGGLCKPHGVVVF